ncbi:MAG: hypothetical protein HYZ27_06650 [Deltaproteobacteria bacterium]|nr:hypothetical protein [Deltaproteobacteria bacterium]
MRRNRGLPIAVGVMLLVSPMLTRVMASYRGVVLEIKDDEMWLGFAGRAPRWVDRIEAQPGAIVEKAPGRWSPQVVEATATDQELLLLQLRYADHYTGVIVEIRLPLNPQGASVALVRTDDGRRIEHALWAEHLATAGVHRRVEKRPHSWDFVLLPDAPPPVTTPPVNTTPSMPAPSTTPSTTPSTPAPSTP